MLTSKDNVFDRARARGSAAFDTKTPRNQCLKILTHSGDSGRFAGLAALKKARLTSFETPALPNRQRQGFRPILPNTSPKNCVDEPPGARIYGREIERHEVRAVDL